MLNELFQQDYNPPKLEKEILKFWEEKEIFKKSVEKRKGNERFVFLEGPPTANGSPHPGHILTRIMKDVILRYYTMNGFYTPRRAGWDTHGLPVEIEVEKELGLRTKQDIEKYGVEKFNERCRESTFRYENEWIEMTKRIGFWIDMDNPYITLDNRYIESVWWSLKKIWEKGLLYKGHKVVPYCPRCGTALSAHEVAQGYKTIKEPSIYVKFKLKEKDAFFLAWTTTPWTLISNVALAVHPEESYVEIEYEGEKLILAEKRLENLFAGKGYKVIRRFKGRDLEYMEYEPIFKFVKPDKKAWYVVCADFVTMEEGTGIVHIAPAFGEEDYEVGKVYDLPIVQLVGKDGKFDERVKPWKGMFVKDADPKIIDYLRESGALAWEEEYVHEYPFCWRCDTPLLYYAMDSWFIAVSKLRENLLRNNENIEWYPSHIKHGRFGDFLREAKDWALSRSRYWGTPLPIWICKKCGETMCIGSIEELKSLSENFPEKIDLHKPFVDNLILKCPKCKGEMKREDYVIDCWYDSGSAFFAQWHYPFENVEEFKNNFPVDFICEALDQTRGWFYSLLAVSTLLFDKPPYRKVLTLGLVLDKQGQKMSKSKKNYVDPKVIFDNEGADPLRWYMISANPPWAPIRFYEEAVKETLRRFMLTLWNSFKFYLTYAQLDKFDPRKHSVDVKNRMHLDRWIISKLQSLIGEVRENVEKFELQKASRAIEEFVVKDLSNWYIRRSRKRLWIEEMTQEKASCYSTLHDVFFTLSRLLAPFIPFLSEAMYLAIKTKDMPESVHLLDYPKKEERLIDKDLERAMDISRRIVELGRVLRGKIGIKVRYPLSKAIIVCGNDTKREIENLLELIKEELNVKEIIFSGSREEAMKIIGENNYAEIEGEGIYLIVDKRLTPELFAEGFSREIVRRIQAMRKEMDLSIEDRIETEISVNEKGKEAIERWKDYISGETRSKKITFTEEAKGELIKKWKIGDVEVTIGIRKGA